MRSADSVRGYFALLACPATGEQYVEWAQNQLEDGLDSPSLLRLAIEEPPYFTPDLARLFHNSVRELDIGRCTPACGKRKNGSPSTVHKCHPEPRRRPKDPLQMCASLASGRGFLDRLRGSE